MDSNKRKPGIWKGQVTMSDNFNKCDEEIANEFLGENMYAIKIVDERQNTSLLCGQDFGIANHVNLVNIKWLHDQKLLFTTDMKHRDKPATLATFNTEEDALIVVEYLSDLEMFDKTELSAVKVLTKYCTDNNYAEVIEL